METVESLAKYKRQYRYRVHREEILKQSKIYRKENKEYLIEQQRKYREENKEEIALYHKNYKINNKEQIAAVGLIYYTKHRKDILLNHKNLRNDPTNREKMKLYQKEYREKNKKRIEKLCNENREIRNKKAREQYHVKKAQYYQV